MTFAMRMSIVKRQTHEANISLAATIVDTLRNIPPRCDLAFDIFGSLTLLRCSGCRLRVLWTVLSKLLRRSTLTPHLLHRLNVINFILVNLLSSQSELFRLLELEQIRRFRLPVSTFLFLLHTRFYYRQV